MTALSTYLEGLARPIRVVVTGGREFIGGDLYSRQSDGKPWVEVAAFVADERFKQERLFNA